MSRQNGKSKQRNRLTPREEYRWPNNLNCRSQYLDPQGKLSRIFQKSHRCLGVEGIRLGQIVKTSGTPSRQGIAKVELLAPGIIRLHVVGYQAKQRVDLHCNDVELARRTLSLPVRKLASASKQGKTTARPGTYPCAA